MTKNIIEINRLVRRINGLLKGEADASLASKLAEEFNEQCQSVNLRLEQCLTMVEAGSASQAIQLAETAPNLLDVVTALEFRQADEWRQYCASKGLPCGDRLNTRAISVLNGCYASGITPQHPIYASYREAILGKRDEAALTALKTIVRLNPSDENAAAELARLDAKMLNLRLEKLAKLLISDPDSALVEVAEIESAGFKSELSGEVWEKAQILRCEHLLNEAEDEMSLEHFEEVSARMDYFNQLRYEHQLDGRTVWQARVDALQAWIDKNVSIRRTESEISILTGQIQTLLNRNDGKGSTNLGVLHKQRESLRAMNSRVEQYKSRLPENLLNEWGRFRGQIDAQIQKQLMRRRVLTIGMVTAALIIFSALGGVYLMLKKSNELAGHIQMAANQQQVRTLEVLLKQAAGGWLIKTARLRDACLKAQKEIEAQKPGLLDYQRSFELLPKDLTSITTAEKILDANTMLLDVQRKQLALSPEVQNETKSSLGAFQDAWAKHCADSSATCAQELDQKASTLEESFQKVKDAKTLDRAEAIFHAVSEPVTRLQETSTKIKELAHLPTKVVERIKNLKKAVQDRESELARITKILEKARTANSLENYADTIVPLSQFSGWSLDCVLAARSAIPMMPLKPNPVRLEQMILAGTNSALYEMIGQEIKSVNVPAKVTPEARQKFVELSRNYAVTGNHQKYRFIINTPTAAPEEYIATDPLEAEEGWRLMPMWKVTDKAACEFERQEYGYFEGHFKLSASQTVVSYDRTDVSSISAAWKNSGFDRLIDARALRFNSSPMAAAESLVTQTNGSILQRAYLLKELVGMMNMQPVESGLIFNQALKAWPQTLKDAGITDLASGDWFINSKIQLFGAKLESCFQSIKPRSFAVSGAIISTLRDIRKQGFDYVGFVGVDGPVWKDTPANGTVWGYRQTDTKPAILYRVADGKIEEVAKPTTYSPLLLSTANPGSLLKNNGISLDEIGEKESLPPVLKSTE